MQITRGKLGALPPPLAGEGWGGGMHARMPSACPLPVPPPQAQGNRMWPVFGERAQHRNRNRVVRATLESSRSLARTIRIQNFHMRLPCPQAGEGTMWHRPSPLRRENAATKESKGQRYGHGPQ